MNHTDTFKPPHNTGDGPDPKEMFGFVTGIFYLTIMCLSAFWQLLMRKGGTIGTRATWFDVGCGNLLLLALRGHFVYSPCFELFTGAMVLMTFLFFYHLLRTLSRKEHVHTQCIGTPYITGSGGEIVEFALGLTVAVCIYWSAPEARPFSIWLGSSALALLVRGWMLEERDRQRSVQMEDALWEQGYMMRNYDRHKKGNE